MTGLIVGTIVGGIVGALLAMRADRELLAARRRVAALESAEIIVTSPHGALCRMAVLDLEAVEGQRGSYRDERTDELHTIDLRMVKRLPG